MKTFRASLFLITLAIVTSPTAQVRSHDPASGHESRGLGRHQNTSTAASPHDPEGFRYLMSQWARANEIAMGVNPDLSDRIAQLDLVTVQAWYDTFSNPEAFVASVERDLQRIQFSQVSPSTGNLAGTLFPPDYPPNSGKYGDLLTELNTRGLTSSPMDRCDTEALMDKTFVWWAAREAFEIADVACVVAGCDPTGVVCAAVCVVVELAQSTAQLGGLAIDECEVHDGNVDSAEIEAAYENTVVIAGDVENARVEVLDNSNMNRDMIVANDNLNRDAIIANDDENTENILMQFTGQEEREFMNTLGRGQCEHWMYTPLFADPNQSVVLGGSLELGVELIQRIIDQAGMLGADTARLVAAQAELDQVLPLSMERPYEAELICRHLAKAYEGARMLPLRSIP